jgi:hypothetical protein
MDLKDIEDPDEHPEESMMQNLDQMIDKMKSDKAKLMMYLLLS